MSATTEQEATQRPAYGSMAEALEATDPEFMDSAPATAGPAPATEAAGEPVAPAEATTQEAPETQAEIDYKAEYEKLQQQITSNAGAELSAAGRLKQANAEKVRLQAERDDFERQLKDQNTRIDKWWEEAIEAAPTDGEKAEYRRLHAIDQRERKVAQAEQQQELAKQQTEQQRAETRQQAEQAARFYAIAELDSAVEMRAKQEGLPPEIFKPVRDWLTSDQHKLLAQTLPLRGKRQMQGDPLAWQLTDIDNLDDFRTYQVARAEQGYRFYTQEYTQAQAKAEEERVAANAQAAQRVYQPEQPVGAGVSRAQRDLSKYRNSNDIAAVLNIEDGLEP